MSASPRIERPEQTAETTTLGKVVAQSSGRTVVLGRLGDGLRMGDRLVFAGAPQVLGVVTGFETPLTDVELTGNDVIFIEVRTVGVLQSDGTAVRSAAQPVMGAESYRLPSSVETLNLAMDQPVNVGERGVGEAVPIDAAKLLGRTLTITGEAASGKSASLAVIMRALLTEGFPARMVLIDPDGAFTTSFGRAASVVDAEETGLPLAILTHDELAAVLGRLGSALTEQERFALLRLRRQCPKDADAAQMARAALECSDETSDSREAFMALALRFEAMLEDERFTLFCGRDRKAMNADDVLQLYFRLPDGRPPAAVIQLHGLVSELRPVVASIFLRLGLGVAQGSGGSVPVLMFVDQSKMKMGPLPDIRMPSFGMVVAGESLAPPTGGLMVLHRIRNIDTLEAIVPEAEPLAAEMREVLPTLVASEALLLNPDYPWPVRFTVSTLPDSAVPGRAMPPHSSHEPQALIRSIADALFADGSSLPG